MSKANVYGLKRVTIGDPANDGGMGSTLIELLGQTVLGTAKLTIPKPSKSGVKTEESDNSIFFIDGENPDITLEGSTYNIGADVMYKLFGGSFSAAGGANTMGTVVGGSLYTTGTYNNVKLTGGTGYGAMANIVVAGGAVTTVTIVSKGAGYTVSDSLTAAAADIGGTGSGFSVPVSAVYSGVQSWSAPVGGVRNEWYQSVVAESRSGIKFNFVKMDMSAGLSIVFDKTKLGQIDWTGMVLQPDKDGIPAWGISYPS